MPLEVEALGEGDGWSRDPGCAAKFRMQMVPAVRLLCIREGVCDRVTRGLEAPRAPGGGVFTWSFVGVGAEF
jgi:hypothetical protein